jgi:DNA-binding transcriptional LysR family regulator
MDKLRAIEYFNRAVETGSLAAAARSLGVSTPAISTLIAALERSLGVRLFNRTARGLSLTAEGQRYYRTSRRVASDLAETEQLILGGSSKVRGTLLVGMRQSVAEHCVMPHIARFLVQFPDVDLVLRSVLTNDVERESIDIAVLVGWPPEGNRIALHLAQTRHVVCASPDYWKVAGIPQHPRDLRDHHCLVFRNDEGVLVDRWSFSRNGEKCSVDVKTRLSGDNRGWLDIAAVSGAGVMRVTDLTSATLLSPGRLVPALTDWDSTEAPTIYALYLRRLRQSKVARCFLDFLTEIFAEIEKRRVPEYHGAVPRNSQPHWFGRAKGRQSAYSGKPKY